MTAIETPPLGLFVTGTDTNVGKTYVASLIAKRLAGDGVRVGVYKPAASGCRRDGDRLICDDAVALWNAAGRPASLDNVCPQCFEAPIAPHLAAEKDGRELDANLLRDGLAMWADACDLVIVEGIGGLMCPLGDEDYVANLVEEFGYPLIVVAPNVVGVINQTVQTLIAAASFGEGLPMAGIILNDTATSESDPSRADNVTEIQKRCVPPVLASVGWNQDSLDDSVDWLATSRQERNGWPRGFTG